MTNAPIAFPQTYDPALDTPRYSASDFRLTAGAALAVPDGSAFGGIQGVRAGSPSPLVTIDGTTVTVAPHMGWLCPWPGGNGAYSYALPSPVSKPIDSTTGSYKIAVILEDKAAGHGKGELVDVKVYPGYMLDSQIQGLVVARVESGVASDVAPVICQDATVRVRTLDQLKTVRAADGTGGVVTVSGQRYVSRGGSWVAPSSARSVTALKFQDTGSFQVGAATPLQVVCDGDTVMLDIPPFLSTVTVNSGFPVLQYVSGPKPSAPVDLGLVGCLTTGNYGKTAIWGVDGGVKFNGLGISDRFVPTCRPVPVPAGVTIQ